MAEVPVEKLLEMARAEILKVPLKTSEWKQENHYVNVRIVVDGEEYVLHMAFEPPYKEDGFRTFVNCAVLQVSRSVECERAYMYDTNAEILRRLKHAGAKEELVQIYEDLIEVVNEYND